MMITIDHAAEARNCLNEAGEALGVDEFAHADLQVKAAQAHATLALADAQEAAAEQARIANWIAYLSQHDKIPAAHREWIEAALTKEDVWPSRETPS